MSGEHQAVDHGNKLIGNDDVTIFVWTHAAQQDTNFGNSSQKANDFAQSSD
jgi:hypothetical protein